MFDGSAETLASTRKTGVEAEVVATMAAAAIGFVGVIVGALMSGFATFFMARRTERRQARAAARLLEVELRDVAGRLQQLGSLHCSR